MRTAGFTLALLVVATVGVRALDVSQDVLDPARAYLGSAYCAGGTEPPCFDCSGFVRYIYRRHVDGLPRVSRDMARVGRAVARRELAPGDLVFFTTGTTPDRITHVAIYAGRDTLIHAISDGPNRGVTMTPLSARYWDRRYHSAVRVLPEGPSRRAPEEPPAGDPSPEVVRFALGSYTGEMHNGQPDGTGTFRYDNGDVYQGEFRDGEPHGTGTYRWADGTEYRGEFRTGRPAESRRETYATDYQSPWNTWDGVVRGDFDAWQRSQEQEFQDFLDEQQNGWRPR